MALCEQHTFQVLTKRPERMVSWSRDVGGVMRRAGKKVAGRLLDGRELNEFPNFGKN
jgi:protein gp37